MEQTVRSYRSLEEIYEYFLPSATAKQKQDHNDPEAIWKTVEKEVVAKLKANEQPRK